MNRRMRTRMSGGVRGGRLAATLLLDFIIISHSEREKLKQAGYFFRMLGDLYPNCFQCFHFIGCKS
jgi:hypothetical protein